MGGGEGAGVGGGVGGSAGHVCPWCGLAFVEEKGWEEGFKKKGEGVSEDTRRGAILLGIHALLCYAYVRNSRSVLYCMGWFLIRCSLPSNSRS